MMCAYPVTRRRDGWGPSVDFEPSELVTLVATALAANAFAYGAVLCLHGVVTLWSLSLLVGGVAVCSVLVCWLLVLQHVRAITSG